MPKVYTADQLALSSEQKELVEKHIALTEKFIGIFNRRYGGYGFDAVYDAGIEALMKSARTFSPEYGTEFGKFLYYNMERELYRVHRDRNAQKRKGDTTSLDKVHDHVDGRPVTLHDLLSVEDKHPFFDTALLKALLTRLNKQERLLITLHYVYDLSQHEIAREIGVSQPHVGRMLKRALLKMREHAVRVS